MAFSRASLPLLFAAAALVLPAQTGDPMSTELKQSYTSIKNNLMKMAEKMPDENYSFKATPDVRTFGALVGHVADSQARTCSSIGGEPKQLGASAKTSKAELVAALKQSFDICDPVFDGMKDEAASTMITGPRGKRTKLGMLAQLIMHSNEEYGYMSVYMRLKGVTPPSSEGR